jgi:esterase/lipase superfamily enzyme
MQREYHHWFSEHLQKDMELLVFGYEGDRMLFFPTRTARFYDYEDWGMINSMKAKINDGLLQVYCVDSADQLSFYNTTIHPKEKISQYLRYERYIIEEVLPFSDQQNPRSKLISAGCSMGAYHAVNTAFKHPHLFDRIVSMSGRYDLTTTMGNFRDLFEGYTDEDVYFNMPLQYVANLNDADLLQTIKNLEVTLAVGQDDAFLQNNMQFNAVLENKGIPHHLHIWDGEAHRPREWGKMLKLYI